MQNWLKMLIVATSLLLGGCAGGAREAFVAVLDLFSGNSLTDAMDEGYGWNNEANAKPSDRSDVRGY